MVKEKKVEKKMNERIREIQKEKKERDRIEGKRNMKKGRTDLRELCEFMERENEVKWKKEKVRRRNEK